MVSDENQNVFRLHLIPFLIENVSFFVAQTVSLCRIRLHFTKTCNAAPFFRNGICYENINTCDSRKIGIIEIINPYRVRVRRIAP